MLDCFIDLDELKEKNLTKLFESLYSLFSPLSSSDL